MPPSPGGPHMRRRPRLTWTSVAGSVPVIVALLAAASAGGADVPVVKKVDAQPMHAQVKRVAQTLQVGGAPLTAEQLAALDKAAAAADAGEGVAAAHAVLD